MTLLSRIGDLITAIGTDIKNLRIQSVTLRDTAANLTATYDGSNPVIAGRYIYETDTKLSKLGDGVTAYALLPYISGVKRTSYGTATTVATLTGSHQLSLGVKRVLVRGWDGGGGGATGASQPAGTVANGGTGGGSGGYCETWIDAADLPANLQIPYRVPVGGAGGASRSAAAQSVGSAGSSASTMYIGSAIGDYGFGVNGGGGGVQGTSGPSAGGIAGYGSGFYGPGQAGGANVSAGTVPSAPGAITNSKAGGGGGSGGGITTASVSSAGANGGYPNQYTAANNAGASNGGAGSVGNSYMHSSGTTPRIGGQGGGGGGSNSNANGSSGQGGDGGFPGGGGGGSGGVPVGSGTVAAGGKGGNAYLEFVEFF